MKKEFPLTCLSILLFLMVFVSAQQIFTLELDYDNGDLTLSNLRVAEGFFNEPVNQPSEGYRLDILSIDGKIIYTQMFNFQLEERMESLAEWFDDEGNQIYIPSINETIKTKDQSNIELILPYSRDSSIIRIYDLEDTILLEKSLSSVEFKESSRSKVFFWVMASGIILVIVISLILLRVYKLSKESPEENSNV